MSRFFFFTDIDSVENQSAGDAFGPVIGFTDSQFRMTSIHRAAAGKTPSAYAVCDGLICAQADDQGMLTMILKPSVQPSFDFPAISYILYKGIDPASLLAADGTIDSAQEADSDLISAIKSAWELEANGNTGSPTRACIGLHLNPADYPDGENPERFADTEPIDRLFYEGDPAIQLPLVRGGWRLGTFSTNLPFGIEIVVERIGRRPKIALARKLENIVEVDALANGADASEVFRHWDAKEAILDFVDPCAFWGSFFAAKLRVWNTTNSEFDKLSGNEIYETVLRGTAAGSAKFANRNRAYIDIRNEHGNSLNYYQADGPNIQLTLDADADIDACEVNYYGSGWPSFAIDNSNLPAGTTGDKVDVRFALPKTANTRPLIYISAGYRGALRRLKNSERFIERLRRSDSPYLEEAAISLPLVQNGGTTEVAGSYHKLCHFKRPLLVDGQPVLPSDPNSLAPSYSGPLDHVFPALDIDVFPSSAGATFVKVSADEVLINWPTNHYSAIVGRLGFARDSKNVYLFVTPTALYTRKAFYTMAVMRPTLPPFAMVKQPSFLADYLAPKVNQPTFRRTFDPETTSITLPSVTEVEVVGSGSKSFIKAYREGMFDAFFILAFGISEYQNSLSPASFSAMNPISMIFITLPQPETHNADDDKKPYYEAAPYASFLRMVGTTISRATHSPTIAVYANENL